MFAVFVACCTFLLIVAGALVTSNDAGLSVPDWPTSFGSLYRLPPMKGGVLFEHGHRMIAQGIGFLTIILAIWTQRVDQRPWMKMLGWGALGTVIAQGILGGLTVLFYLPPAISTAHATLAQTFFCIVISLALFTGRNWVESETEPLVDRGHPNLVLLSSLTVLCVWLQLILGAAFRHSGLKLIPHLIGATIVTCMIGWTTLRTIRSFIHIYQLRKPALALSGFLVLQISLGLSAYLTRMIWSTVEPQMIMVVATVTHVSIGAVILVTSVILAIQTRRYVTTEQSELSTDTQRTATA